MKDFNAHHDYAGLGVALPDRMHWNAMMAMKKAGFNLYRSSHNPPTKDVYYYFVSQYTEKPILHLFPHWNWPGKEGKPIEVWYYSNCDSVEVFLNDISLGVRHRAADPKPFLPSRQK